MSDWQDGPVGDSDGEPEDPDDDEEADEESMDPHRRGTISVAHAVDLIVAGAEVAEKLNQLDALRECLPAVKDAYIKLLNILEELGFDPLAFVRGNKRLAALAEGLVSLQADMDPSLVYADTLDFLIAGSPLLSLRRVLRAHVRRLPRKTPICLLRLADGQLHISAHDWGVSIPAVFDTEGVCLVRRSFVDILLESLKTDEVIRCHVEPRCYRVNGFTHEGP